MEEKNVIDDKQKNEQTLIPEQVANDPVKEAQVVNELSQKIKNLEAENEKYKEAQKKYYDGLINGQTSNENVQKVRSKDEIRADISKELKSGKPLNLNLAKLYVELDENVRANEGESGFTPKGRNAIPTADEKLTAERLHDCLETCIEEANGDPEAFNIALEKRMKKK